MAKTKKSQKKPVSQVRKSALRKPSSKVSSDTKLLVPKSNSQKVEDANLLQAEVFERAKSANALATSSVKEKKDKKGNKEKSKKEKKDHKEVEATEEKDKKQQKKLKDKKDKEKKSKDKTTDQKPLEKRTKGESATDQRSKDEKSADKKKGEKKEGKERKKPGDSTKATKAGNKSKENAEALEAAEKTKEKEEKERALALELKKASVPGPAPTTPPAKRLRMKSPTESTVSGSSSVHTDATSTRYQSTKDMAEAHFAKLRRGLSAAVKEAEENAHLDCAGMSMEGLLEELRAEKKETNDEGNEAAEEGADEAQEDEEGEEEEEAEVDEEEEEEEEAEEGDDNDDDDEAQEDGDMSDGGDSNDDSVFEGTEDEAASDPSSGEDDGEEEGRKAEEKSKENEDQKAKDEAKDEALQIAIANTTRNSNLYERQGVWSSIPAQDIAQYYHDLSWSERHLDRLYPVGLCCWPLQLLDQPLPLVWGSLHLYFTIVPQHHFPAEARPINASGTASTDRRREANSRQDFNLFFVKRRRACLGYGWISVRIGIGSNAK